MADGTPVTATVGNGGLTPSILGAVEEWLALNASVRWAGEWQGRLSLIRRGVASSEAEVSRLLEGSFATLERGGDRPAGPRRVRMGRMLGFFESFPFFQMGSRPWAFVGPVALIGVLCFKAILSPQLGCP